MDAFNCLKEEEKRVSNMFFNIGKQKYKIFLQVLLLSFFNEGWREEFKTKLLGIALKLNAMQDAAWYDCKVWTQKSLGNHRSFNFDTDLNMDCYYTKMYIYNTEYIDSCLRTLKFAIKHEK